MAGMVRPAAAGVHPFAAPEGEINRGSGTSDSCPSTPLWRRQLVCALCTSPSRGPRSRFNGRGRNFPDLAALAANAPFFGGGTRGSPPSVRPSRRRCRGRGCRPASRASRSSPTRFWRGAAGVVPEPRRWWWSSGLTRCSEPRAAGSGHTADRGGRRRGGGLRAGALRGGLRRAPRRAGRRLDAPTWRIEEKPHSGPARRGGNDGRPPSGERTETRGAPAR